MDLARAASQNGVYITQEMCHKMINYESIKKYCFCHFLNNIGQLLRAKSIYSTWNMSMYCTLQRQCTKKFETNIPRNETARPPSQFLHSCIFEQLIYS
jgi:hypothetical protein